MAIEIKSKADLRLIDDAARKRGFEITEGKKTDAPKDSRPRIDTASKDLPAIAQQVYAALLKRDQHRQRLYEQSGFGIVRLADHDGSREIDLLDEHKVRFEVSNAATFINSADRGKDQYPPIELARYMLADPAPPFRPLQQIVRAPRLQRDGSITKPGYNPPSQLYYDAGDLKLSKIPETPTEAEIKAAVSLIQEWIGDFPFTGEAERAHAIAHGLLPFVRDLIDSPTPAVLFDKAAPGSGASLLVEVLAIPVLGSRKLDPLTEATTEDEWRKRIIAALLGLPQIIYIDNVNRTLAGAALASAITATHYSDRLLGSSRIVRAPVTCAWAITGNNPNVAHEMARRIIRCRIDPRCEHPHLRDPSSFRHPKLKQWTLENRGRLVTAFLTIATAWHAAGRPAPSHGRSLGMFESWSDVIGGILEVAGIDGFLGNLQEFYDVADDEAAVRRAFVSEWLAAHGNQHVAVAQLLPAAMRAGVDLGDKSDRSQAIRLGRTLGRMRDMRFGLDGRQVVVQQTGTVRRAAYYRLAEGHDV